MAVCVLALDVFDVGMGVLLLVLHLESRNTMARMIMSLDVLEAHLSS